MSKVILAVCDALRNDIAAEDNEESLVEENRPSNTWQVVSQLQIALTVCHFWRFHLYPPRSLA